MPCFFRNRDSGPYFQYNEPREAIRPLTRSFRYADSQSNYRRAYEKPPTFGTYIYPSPGKRYATRDSANCPCMCCPHSAASSRHVGRHDRNRDRYNSTSYFSSPPTSPTTRGRRESGSYNPVAGATSSAGVSPIRRRSGSTSQGTVRKQIEVVDKTNGSFFRRYGKRFLLSVSRDATVMDIIQTLAPEQRRDKVMVQWKDGPREVLDQYVSVRELLEYGHRLEIKHNKTVHWK